MKEEQRENHVLLSWHPEDEAANWPAWLDLWTRSCRPSEKISLLHEGFNSDMMVECCQDGVRCTSADRILFYLNIADRWAFRNTFWKEGDGEVIVGQSQRSALPINKPACDSRQEVATKAFKMLCTHVFRPLIEVDGGHERALAKLCSDYFANPRLMVPLMDFFRVEKVDGQRRVVNLSSELMRDVPEQKHAFKFLCRLVRNLWTSCPTESCALYERKFAARPWGLAALAVINRLDVVEDFVLSYGPSCLEELKTIALETRLVKYKDPVGESREVKTVEEACCAGSPAARLLILARIAQAEHDRLVAEENIRVIQNAQI